MRKTKKHNKFLRKNRNKTKTHIKKYYGGDIEEREGVVDSLENKASELTSDAGEYLWDKGLRLLGAERIDENQTPEQNTTSQMVDAVSATASQVGEKMDEGAAGVLGTVNNALKSETVESAVESAAEETKEVVTNLADKFNEQFEDPETKIKLEKAMDNASEVAEITLKSMDKPINTALDELNKVGKQEMKNLGTASVGVLTDMAGAIPFAGAIVNFGKAVNDGSKALAAAAGLTSKVIEVGSDITNETLINVDDAIKQVNENKEESDNVLNRVEDSRQEFENPITQTAGKKKRTKRRFLKKKGKSKRVRFNL